MGVNEIQTVVELVSNHENVECLNDKIYIYIIFIHFHQVALNITISL